MNHRECLGAAKCPFAEHSFAERAKEKALHSQLIVTNHSLRAIDAIEDVPMIPSTTSSPSTRPTSFAARMTGGSPAAARGEVERAGPARNGTSTAPRRTTSPTRPTLRAAYATSASRRINHRSYSPPTRCVVWATRPGTHSAFPKDRPRGRAHAGAPRPGGGAGPLTTPSAWFRPPTHVLWLTERDSKRGGDMLCVAPLQGGRLRDWLCGRVALTSAR